MIPKKLTFEIPDEENQTAELSINLQSEVVEIYDGESTATLTINQLTLIAKAAEQVNLLIQREFIAKTMDIKDVQNAIKPEAAQVMETKIVDQLPPPLSSLQALMQRDAVVSEFFVVGNNNQYYPNQTEPGRAVEFVNKVASARLFEKAEQAYEVAKNFPNCNVYKFKDIGSYRIVVPETNGQLGYYNGTGRTSNHVNDSIQIIGRNQAKLTSDTITGAFLLPVTE